MAEGEKQASGSVAPPGAAPPAVSGTTDPGATDASIPQDTDDTLGSHYRMLAVSPLVLSFGATAIVVAFVIGTSAAGAAVGALAAAGTFLVIAGVLYAISSGRAKEDFFEAYADRRSLRRTPEGGLPPTTPLLRKGDRRYANQIMNWTLPGGLPGTLALYTYEEQTTDSDGDRDTSYYHFTVVLHEIPAAAYRLSDLHCQRRSGFRFMDSAEDVFRRMQRLELESEALDRRYEIFYGPNDDGLWVRQLFAPSFVVWLAEQAPKDFAFEFSGGALCVNVTGHHDSAAELDELCEGAATVARRLAEEAAE